ncbi:lytic transglycosylase domain-containing protein [Limibacter armeniacum]|uniref:lytic transglycosylase domain-containing protein n=1 Tax=Limibacter armeniacum TaxID=466084 RepID=UPI002FE63B96
MKNYHQIILAAAGLLVLGSSSCNFQQPQQSQQNAIASMEAPKKEQANPLLNIDLPESFTFCGEKVKMEDIDVRERFDRELYVNTFWHSSTILMLKRANRWLPVIEEVLKEEGVPEDFKYLSMIESGLQNVVSPAGARGFWQFLSGTAKDYGLTVNGEVDERYHVEKSTRAACSYLKEAKDKLGSWTLAAAAYNRGVNGVRKALNEQKADDYYDLLLNEETSRYLFRILAIKMIHSDPQQYGFDLNDRVLYTQERLKYEKVEQSISDLPAYAQEKGISYKLLKRYNPWLRDSKLTLKNGESYLIALPR